MALLKILEVPNPLLKKKSAPVAEVTDDLRKLMNDMLETMYESNGVGLAAPQVGILKRIVVIDITPDASCPHVLINPVITEQDGEQTGMEGCLSVPGKQGQVTRPNHVRVQALDGNMQPIELEGEELLARAICHELDHLDGHLYVELAEGELVDVQPPTEEDEED